MVTARPLAASRVTLPSASPNLNKDARITKAGDKAGDGDSMRVAARRRRSTARHRGCRLQGGFMHPSRRARCRRARQQRGRRSAGSRAAPHAPEEADFGGCSALLLLLLFLGGGLDYSWGGHRFFPAAVEAPKRRGGRT